uniref:Uncharacterized protein n=1 Tax=Tanacetum cinerariifolium TaxID=118510 RepID=A0A6L2J2Z0_TANCI|nr:hypothetical protein [Tanacetum cinerariifolium]
MSQATSLFPIRSKEELVSKDKQVRLSSRNVRIDTEEIFTYPIHQLETITSRMTKQTKAEKSTYPQFTQLIIAYLMSTNTAINKRSDADMHRGSMDEEFKPTKETSTKRKQQVKEKQVKEKSKKVKEMYVDDPDQIHVATLLSAESERLILERLEREQIVSEEEIDDDVDDTLAAIKTQKLKGIAETDDEPHMSHDAQLLINFKKDSKLSKEERFIQEFLRGLGEGSTIRNENQDDRDSLDSDKTLSAPRLENFIDEGEEDDALNFKVFVHGKKYDVKEKDTPIHTTISSPKIDHLRIMCHVNETSEPSLEDVNLSRNVRMSGLNSHDGSSRKEEPSEEPIYLDWLTESQTVVVSEVAITKPIGPDQRGSIIVNPEIHLTLGKIPTIGLLPRGNPKLTRCTSCAFENPSDALP